MFKLELVRSFADLKMRYSPFFPQKIWSILVNFDGFQVYLKVSSTAVGSCEIHLFSDYF